MNILNKIEEIRPVLERELRISIEKCISEYNPFGYALRFGEDLELAAPIAVTTKEADIADKYSRYTPDEWNDWHYDHFLEFGKLYDSFYEEYFKKYDESDEDCGYTKEAWEFAESIYTLYLDTMKKITKDYDSISYWVIWIPDCGRGIVDNSVFELNKDVVVKDASEYFFKKDSLVREVLSRA